MSKMVLGIIGGSGVYNIPHLENAYWEAISSPWGQPSDSVRRGRLRGVDIVFLPRHGRGHIYTPTMINYRANIDILKRAGVTDIYSFTACGSLKVLYEPEHFVIVDQFIDRTFAREKSFFGTGCVAHVSMAEPVCSRLADIAEKAIKQENVGVHRGGTYLVMEGPQFSSKAESTLYRQWGCDVIGMTNMPEAKLAREAELPYATVAMVTDYDCWHLDHDAVAVTDVVTVLQRNAHVAENVIVRIAEAIGLSERTPSPQGIETVLDTAIITAPDSFDKILLAKLDAVAGRYLKTLE